MRAARRGDNDGMRRLLPQAGGVTSDGLNSRDKVSLGPIYFVLCPSLLVNECMLTEST
jgi:hypothetical protein